MPPKTSPQQPKEINSPTRRPTPVKTLRFGRIKAAIWENDVDQRKMYNVTFARTYMDEQKNFHDTDSFGRDDLPLVSKLADQAHTLIFELLAKQRSDEPG